MQTKPATLSITPSAGEPLPLVPQEGFDPAGVRDEVVGVPLCDDVVLGQCFKCVARHHAPGIGTIHGLGAGPGWDSMGGGGCAGLYALRNETRKHGEMRSSYICTPTAIAGLRRVVGG